jgi:hypothetical protein
MGAPPGIGQTLGKIRRVSAGAARLGSGRDSRRFTRRQRRDRPGRWSSFPLCQNRPCALHLPIDARTDRNQPVGGLPVLTRQLCREGSLVGRPRFAAGDIGGRGSDIRREFPTISAGAVPTPSSGRLRETHRRASRDRQGEQRVGSGGFGPVARQGQALLSPGLVALQKPGGFRVQGSAAPRY